MIQKTEVSLVFESNQLMAFRQAQKQQFIGASSLPDNRNNRQFWLHVIFPTNTLPLVRGLFNHRSAEWADASRGFGRP